MDEPYSARIANWNSGNIRGQHMTNVGNQTHNHIHGRTVNLLLCRDCTLPAEVVFQQSASSSLALSFGRRSLSAEGHGRSRRRVTPESHRRHLGDPPSTPLSTQPQPGAARSSDSRSRSASYYRRGSTIPPSRATAPETRSASRSSVGIPQMISPSVQIRPTREAAESSSSGPFVSPQRSISSHPVQQADKYFSLIPSSETPEVQDRGRQKLRRVTCQIGERAATTQGRAETLRVTSAITRAPLLGSAAGFWTTQHRRNQSVPASPSSTPLKARTQDASPQRALDDAALWLPAARPSPAASSSHSRPLPEFLPERSRTVTRWGAGDLGNDRNVAEAGPSLRPAPPLLAGNSSQHPSPATAPVGQNPRVRRRTAVCNDEEEASNQAGDDISRSGQATRYARDLRPGLPRGVHPQPSQPPETAITQSSRNVKVAVAGYTGMLRDLTLEMLVGGNDPTDIQSAHAMRYMPLFALKFRCPRLLALWTPHLADYRSAELGDVGFFTSNGGFYSLFNLIHKESTRNDPPPSNFVCFVDPPLGELVLTKDYHIPKNSGIQPSAPLKNGLPGFSIELNPRNDKHNNRATFTATVVKGSSTGHALLLPLGGTVECLQSTVETKLRDGFKNLKETHIWLEYCDSIREQKGFGNAKLVVVTERCMTSSWAVASYISSTEDEAEKEPSSSTSDLSVVAEKVDHADVYRWIDLGPNEIQVYSAPHLSDIQMLAAGEALPRDICIAVGGMVVDFKKIETSGGMDVPQSTNTEGRRAQSIVSRAMSRASRFASKFSGRSSAITT